MLSVVAFERLGTEQPALQAALMRNLLIGFYEILGRMSREVGSFSTAAESAVDS